MNTMLHVVWFLTAHAFVTVNAAALEPNLNTSGLFKLSFQGDDDRALDLTHDIPWSPIQLAAQEPGTLQDLVDAMRAADVDRLPPNRYQLDWGNHVEKRGDSSPNKLFTFVDESIFSRPVYAKLIQLYEDHIFNPTVCREEPSMYGQRKERFIDIINTFTNTEVFRLAHQYLVQQGKADADIEQFRAFLLMLWFETYTRCFGTPGSSGFEHVFVGEWKKHRVDGHHSWVHYYLAEKAGEINYMGYYTYVPQLTGTFRYTWKGNMKRIGGFLIGTSPAFDFSLYTVCVLANPGKKRCQFSLDGVPVKVTSFADRCGEDDEELCLATSYPSTD